MSLLLLLQRVWHVLGTKNPLNVIVSHELNLPFMVGESPARQHVISVKG